MVNKKTRKRGKTKNMFFLNKLVVKNFNNLKNYTKKLLFGKTKTKTRTKTQTRTKAKRKNVQSITAKKKKQNYKLKGGSNCKTHTLQPANYDENFSDKNNVLNSVSMN